MIAAVRPASAPPVGSAAVPAPGPRFTLDGDDALEAFLALTCARVRSAICGLVPAGRLEALMLGGGYGRGEGGVLAGPDGDRPYNDLEFYVALRGNRHLSELRYRRRLEVLGEILTHLADVEIEFKITSLAELAARPVSMFSYDLLAGHRLLWSRGDAPLPAGCDHHRCAGDIPPGEGTRLLMNRCSGLLFARRELDREPLSPSAADFVRRNLAKAQLACGDALLTGRGRYHWSCRERHRRLGELAAGPVPAFFADVLRHHAAGVAFKLHPVEGGLPRAALLTLHHEIAALARESWLYLEESRLGRPFPSVRAYVEAACHKCTDTPSLRNLLLNLRVDGPRWRPGPRAWHHPRERAFHALALLLWEPDTGSDPARRHRLACELRTPAADLGDGLAAYRRLWGRVR